MEIVFASLDDSLARFTLSGASTAFANAFRRAMIGEVPTLAIEDVRIYDNTSALFDEMLAHRLGLIPIKTDLTDIFNPGLMFVRRGRLSRLHVHLHPQCSRVPGRSPPVTSSRRTPAQRRCMRISRS